jgi:hypothetical protein
MDTHKPVAVFHHSIKRFMRDIVRVDMGVSVNDHW